MVRWLHRMRQAESPRSSESDDLGLRRAIAIGCRILAHTGLAGDILGHISVRTGRDLVLVRCRGPHERGLLFTEPDDVKRVSFEGAILESGDYSAPNELPLHIEALRARPDIDVVVHAHPPAVITANLAGIELVPAVGAYNIPAARLAHEGIPVFERGVLINTSELGQEMAAAMGDRMVCVLRGHGLTTVGTTVEQAIGRAVAVDALARILCGVGALGARAESLPEADLLQLPDLGATFNDRFMWQHLEAQLEQAGLGLPRV